MDFGSISKTRRRICHSSFWISVLKHNNYPSWNRWCRPTDNTSHFPAIHQMMTRTIRINFQHRAHSMKLYTFCNLRFYDWNSLSSAAIIIPMVDFHLNEMNRALSQSATFVTLVAHNRFEPLPLKNDRIVPANFPLNQWWET